MSKLEDQHGRDNAHRVQLTECDATRFVVVKVTAKTSVTLPLGT